MQGLNERVRQPAVTVLVGTWLYHASYEMCRGDSLFARRPHKVRPLALVKRHCGAVGKVYLGRVRNLMGVGGVSG